MNYFSFVMIQYSYIYMCVLGIKELRCYYFFTRLFILCFYHYHINNTQNSRKLSTRPKTTTYCKFYIQYRYITLIIAQMFMFTGQIRLHFYKCTTNNNNDNNYPLPMYNIIIYVGSTYIIISCIKKLL